MYWGRQGMAWTITGSSLSMPSTPTSSRSPTRAGPTRIEVVIEPPLGDGVTDGMKHVFVSDSVLAG
jgi:hypothetical protein